MAALPLIELIGSKVPTQEEQPTNLTFPLNANWLFGGQYMAGSESVFYNDSNFAPVALPHSVTGLSWRNWNPDAWQQIWIYRRHFSGGSLVSSHPPGNRIFVDFDGVMVNAMVVINDQPVFTHQGGYLPFSAELTSQVTAGDNLLSVIVDARSLPVPPLGPDNGPYSIDFFQPGGIYRDVTLRVVPRAFLSDLFAQPTNVLTPQCGVNVEATIDSGLASAASGTLTVELLDGSRRITTQAVTVTFASNTASTAKLSLTGLGPISLWSTTNPKLYTVRATLTVPGVGSHVLTRRIGFRELSFQPDGFYLNGERLQLFGLNRHQLFPYAGMAMPARVQRRDAEILKNELNCNMVRCSHYPQSPHFLDACDELGLLVWEEAPGWHNVSSNPAWQDLVIQNVRDMVIRDRSRPSVAIWGTRLNETPDVPGLWASTRQVAAELDGSRPSSGAMAFHSDTRWNEDVFGYNDYGIDWKTGNPTLRPPLPGVPYLITESVGVEDAKPEYFTWTDPPELLVKQAELHAQAQNLARSHPGYSGLLAWAGFDYASLLSLDPDAVKWAGVMDSFRVPKPGAAMYQAQVDPAIRPVIVPLFFWELGGALPVPAPTAMIASNCDELQIFIDSIPVATATAAVHSPLYGNLPYPPFFVRLPARTRTGLPELLIQGWVNGQQVTELRMSSDPSGDRLALTADDPAISADGADATRVLFRAVDAYGNQRRYLVGEVSLNLSGPGILVGDNPFEFGEYGGLGAVWVRSLPGQPGTITVTATHPDLGRAQVRVQSQPVPQADQVILLFALKLARVQRELMVSELGPGEFTARLDQVISVYAAAMRPAADTLAGRRSIMAGHAAYPGFRALTVAEDDESGEAVGFGYGFRGAPGQWWHDTVARALAANGGAQAAAAWLDDTFEVAELHVAPGYQGSGIGSGLLLRLTSGRPERTAVLSTRDDETRARRLYRGVGFTDLLTSFSFYPGSEPPYAVMGAELPLRALPPGPGSARLRWPSPSRW